MSLSSKDASNRTPEWLVASHGQLPHWLCRYSDSFRPMKLFYASRSCVGVNISPQKVGLALDTDVETPRTSSTEAPFGITETAFPLL